MKIAIVHDWLTGMRGGERCLLAFLRMYPTADLYTLIHIPGTTDPEIDRRVVGTSWLNQLPGVRKYYRALLPLFPFATNSLKLTGYDLVISLSHAAAKNVRVDSGCCHVCYCFTPMRYIWDQARQYLGALTPLFWPLILILRAWDKRGSQGVTEFVAISRFVAARIRKFYGRRAAVIYPPADLSRMTQGELKAGEQELLDSLGVPAFLCAGALVPYKRIDLAIKVCNRSGWPLWIVGSGPEEARLRRMAGSTVRFLGRVSDHALAQIYAKASALIFPGVEDFGLVPIECMAAGTPVIAKGEGALLETLGGVRPGIADAERRQFIDAGGGVIVESGSADTDEEGLLAAIRYFCDNTERFSADAVKKQAAKFSYAEFFEGWSQLCRSKALPEPDSDMLSSGVTTPGRVGT